MAERGDKRREKIPEPRQQVKSVGRKGGPSLRKADLLKEHSRQIIPPPSQPLRNGTEPVFTVGQTLGNRSLGPINTVYAD